MNSQAQTDTRPSSLYRKMLSEAALERNPHERLKKLAAAQVEAKKEDVCFACLGSHHRLSECPEVPLTMQDEYRRIGA